MKWRKAVFGASDAAFALAAGRTDAAAANVRVTRHSGPSDAKWVFDEVPVVGGQYFVFSNWYKSESQTEIYASFQGGSVPYLRVATVPPSETGTSWTKFTAPGFFVPSGATAMTVTHVLPGLGTLTTDDYSLVLSSPPSFGRGLVSLTFDDGWKSVYKNAIPILNRAGLGSTQYVHTRPVVLEPEKFKRNVAIDNLLTMQLQGHDIAAHSRSHLDLVNDVNDEEARRREVDGSRQDLLNIGVEQVDSFAYPFGKYDEDLKEIVSRNFIGARTTEAGYNRTDTDKFALKAQSITSSTTAEQVSGWIDHAVANNLWLILAFHRVEPTLEDCNSEETGQFDAGCTDVALIQAIADYLASMPPGTVRTVHEVLSNDDLWSPPTAPTEVTSTPELSEEAPSFDPHSSYAGVRLSLDYMMNAAYAAGFRSEEQLVHALGVAIGESDLWTAARNWQPQHGYRDIGDVIGVHGPKSAWSSDGRQMHSDRGVFQVSSYWWSGFTDEVCDSPEEAAAIVYELSKQGTDFSLWDSFKSGRAQSHFDSAADGWPALRPIVRRFLDQMPDVQPVALVQEQSVEQTPASVVVAEAPVTTSEPPPAEPVADPPTVNPSGNAGRADGNATALESAAANGNAWAKIGLADSLLRGNPSAADADRAVALLREAEADGLGGPALGTLGMYYRSIGDYEQAAASFAKAADGGNGWAQFHLAEMLLDGKGMAADPDRAVRLLEEAASHGMKGASSRLLARYYRSIGAYAQMATRLTTAAELGDDDAKYQLAVELLGGEHLPADPARAVVLLTEAADGGMVVPASKALAEYHLARNEVVAAALALEKAVAAGDRQSKLGLGRLLLQRDDADAERAIALLEDVGTGEAFAVLGEYFQRTGQAERAFAALEKAAEAGVPSARRDLGERLLSGEGGAADPARGIGLLEEFAAGSEDTSVLLQIGKYYLDAGNPTKAASALERAVKSGDADAKQLLGQMLISEDGHDGDRQRAIALLEESASSGRQGPNYLAIGEYYRAAGESAKALDALELAAAAGEARAVLSLGEMLIGADASRAEELLREAADAGLADSAFAILGGHYRALGRFNDAAESFRKAADAGNISAKIALGEMLITGQGVPADKAAARLLLEEALALGGDATAYAGLIGLAAEDYRDGASLDLAVSLLHGASQADAALAVAAISERPENQKTALVQALLKKRELYSGTENGKLTKATLTAIQKFCSLRKISECRAEALPMAFLKALIDDLGDQARTSLLDERPALPGSRG